MGVYLLPEVSGSEWHKEWTVMNTMVHCSDSSSRLTHLYLLPYFPGRLTSEDSQMNPSSRIALSLNPLSS